MSLVVKDKGRFWTRNAQPGVRVYGERLTRLRGAEYRQWSAPRSKLGAYLAQGGSKFRPQPDEAWLYLGAASGTTVSHVADAVPQGSVVAVEFSTRPFHDLVALAQSRTNILPVLSDAGRPESYEALLTRRADVVYQDIAQRDQEGLFVTNVKRFLRPGGLGFLAVKARSIDVTAAPPQIFARVRQRLSATPGLKVEEIIDLAPWQKDHAMFVVRT